MMARQVHLFPSRTQKLSTFAPMIVGWIARKSRTLPISFLYYYMPPQLSWLEHMTVNHGVIGSSPIGGAIVGLLEKRLNSHAFHACIHGFESRTGHHSKIMSYFVRLFSFLIKYIDILLKLQYNIIKGGLAQLGEHLPYKQGVGGSIPSTSTICRLSSIGRATDL